MDDSGRLAPGTVVGGEYEIVRELARGGMGALFVARHRGSDQLRALKTMHAHYVTDPTMRVRFAREARVSAQIESDHAVEVFGAGVDDVLHIPWMAMELLDGEDLSHLVERSGAMSVAEVATAMAQLGHCLAAAHRAGIVHRDLKAANVFLAKTRRQGEPFTVKVLDFGIAKFLNLATLNATTSAIGSPLWMAPEQTNPETPITPATDVWSLGLMAFFLLTGRIFWITPTYPNANIAALLGELLMLPIPSASSRAAALGVDGRIPPGFDEWFARCLSRDAFGRFADASTAVPPLVALLQRAAPAVAAPTPSPGPEAARVAGRKLSAVQMLPQVPLASTHPDVHVPPTRAMPVMTLAGPPTAAPVAPVTSLRPPPADPPVRSRRASIAVVGVAALLTVALAAAGLWAFQRTRSDRRSTVTFGSHRRARSVRHGVAVAPVVPQGVAVAPVARPVAAPPAAAPAPPPQAEPPTRSRRSTETPRAPVFTLPTLTPSPDYDRERDRRRRRHEDRDGEQASPFGRVFRRRH